MILKHKETLPFYDSFPLVIIIGKAKGGFLGMNLHYLPPTLRAKFLDALMENAGKTILMLHIEQSKPQQI